MNMKKDILKIAFALVLATSTVANAQAEEKTDKATGPESGMTANARALLAATYESCSTEAAQRFGVINDFRNKLPLEDAKKKSEEAPVVANIELLYKLADVRGVAEAYVTVLGNYAFCMKDVKPDDVQSTFTGKPRYLPCGEEAAIDYKIVGDLKKGSSAEDLYAALPSAFHDKIRFFAGKSVEDAAKAAASSALTCIEAERVK